jgi:hypothetical protein
MRRRISVLELRRGDTNRDRVPPPRAALVDDEPDEEPITEAEMQALLATRPKSRSECCPTPDTVICPVEGCGAAVGRPCWGNPAQGFFHKERTEKAREHLRPCPWVSCPHHRFLSVAENGTIIFNFPNSKPWEIPRTCELDDVESIVGEVTLEALGSNFSLTRERMRQIEAGALRQLTENASHLHEDESYEDTTRRLDAEALARRTTFSARPPKRSVVVGNCPDCQQQRRRVGNQWKCGCRRRKRADEG